MMKGHPPRKPGVMKTEQLVLIALLVLLGLGVVTIKHVSTYLDEESALASEVRNTRLVSSPTAAPRQHLLLKEAEVDRTGFWIEKLLDSPRVFILHNLITPEEADILMEYGKEKGMSEALITPYGSNQLVPSTTRTNTAAWLDFQQNELVQKVENKIAEVTGTEPEDGENLQILHYANDNQYFQEHRDYFDPKEDPPDNFAQGGNRMVTAIVYLKTPEEGGDTYFTKLDLPLKVKPGDAIIFWNLKHNGEVDPDTYHSALPPRKGEKWVAVKWIHERAYQKTPTSTKGGSPVRRKKVELIKRPVAMAS